MFRTIKEWKRSGVTSLLSKCSLQKERKSPILYMDHILNKFTKQINTDYVPTQITERFYERFLDGFGESIANYSEEFIVSVFRYCTIDTRIFNCEDILVGFINACKDHHERCVISPGTPVGVVAVQSFSERLTQATLNSFHLSGTKDSPVVGVQSILEMLKATKNPSCATIYPFPENIDIAPVILEEMIVRFGTMFYPTVKYLKNGNVRVTNSTYCKYFDLNKKFRHVYTMLAKLLKRQENIDCIFVDEDTMVLSKRQPVSCLKIQWLMKSLVKGIGWGSDWTMSGGVLSLNDNTFNMNFIDFDYINQRVDGLLDTDFFTKIRTNHLHFIYNNLGIEATRSYLMETIPTIVSKEGINISLSHIELIIDVMTHAGVLSPYTRNGLNVEEGVLLRASFETNTKALSDASSGLLHDDIKCPTSSIIVGKSPEIGTMYNLEIVERGFDGCKPFNSDEEPHQPIEMAINTSCYEDQGFSYAVDTMEMSPQHAPASPMSDIFNDDDVHFIEYDSEYEDESPVERKRQKMETDSPEMEIDMDLD